MKLFTFCSFLILITMASLACCSVISTKDGMSSLHFGYMTDNGQTRTEDIQYNTTASVDEKNKDAAKPVEYRGGYSFISADGYEYTVLYKANKKGFHPYVTARKVKDPK